MPKGCVPLKQSSSGVPSIASYSESYAAIESRYCLAFERQNAFVVSVRASNTENNVERQEAGIEDRGRPLPAFSAEFCHVQ